MSVLAWITIGIIAGLIAGRIVHQTPDGAIVDVILGITGAVAGGWLLRVFEMTGTRAPNHHSAIAPVIGAMVVLVVYHTMFRRFRVGRI